MIVLTRVSHVESDLQIKSMCSSALQYNTIPYLHVRVKRFWLALQFVISSCIKVHLVSARLKSS